jgi:ABC-type transporter Mla maintaining outer membrane lipid asymmetry ATPase subunit MlaF
MPDLLQLRDASKSFGSHAVFSRVNLNAAPGTLTALRGWEDSGKTTLLRCIAGVEPLSSGKRIARAPAVGIVTVAASGPPIPAFSCVDMAEPSIVVADEPTYCLGPTDFTFARYLLWTHGHIPHLSEQVVGHLLTIARQGHAVIVATHDEVVLRAAHSVVDL